MRWLAVLVLVFAADAAAKIVIMEPPIVRQCRDGKTWAAVEACLKPIGALTIERTLPNAKLVRVVDRSATPPADQGVYLYVQEAGGWHIGGMYEGGDYTVTNLGSVTIGKHTGFRIDVVQVARFRSSLDGVTPIQTTTTTRRSLFCAGDQYSCPDATTRCDVMVKGKVVLTFQGRIEIVPNEIHVIGDRDYGGTACTPEGRVFLGWPET